MYEKKETKDITQNRPLKISMWLLHFMFIGVRILGFGLLEKPSKWERVAPADKMIKKCIYVSNFIQGYTRLYCHYFHPSSDQ